MVDSVCIGCDRTIDQIMAAGKTYAQKKKAAKAGTMKCFACRGVPDVGCEICDGTGAVMRS